MIFFRTAVGVAVVLAPPDPFRSDGAAPPAQQQAPVFRGGTTVVPLTVTSLYAKGAPVKDLTAADFTVVETRNRGRIVAFFPQELAAGQCRPATSRRCA
jgi:hypothetical protein